MFSLMLILIICILILPGIRIKKEASGLSLDESTALKGLLCVTIFFHHFSGWFTDLDPVLYLISHCGSFIVSVFFFLSAYGLSKSSKWQNQTFKDLILRILKLCIPFWITDILYLIVHFCMDIRLSVDVNLKNILLSTLNLSEIVSFSWFVSTIVFLYCVLFVVKRSYKINHILLFFIVLSIASFIVPNLWVTFFAFPVGLLISEKEKYLINLKTGQYILWSILLVAGTVLFIILKYISVNYDYKMLLDKTADAGSGLLFSVLVYLLLTKVHIGNKLVFFLGKISYEFYLVHGLGILFANKFFDISQPFLFFGTALIFNLTASYIINTVSKPIRLKISKL